jgi:hypothetical protein
MTGVILIGLALMLGDTLPASIQLLMLIGGVASFIAPGVSGSGQQSDPGASYPYPAQEDVLDGDDDGYD